MTNETSASRSELDDAALFFHRYPRPGKLEIQATKPLGNQRDLALAYSPGVAAPCLAIARRSRPRRRLHGTRQSRRGALQRHRRPRPRQYRPAGRQAGDGRQGGPVQEVRRYRRLRHRDRRERASSASSTSSPRSSRPSAASISRTSRRRNASRSRSSFARAHEDSRLPRRPARHRHHRLGGGPQRPGTRRQADRRRRRS